MKCYTCKGEIDDTHPFRHSCVPALLEQLASLTARLAAAEESLDAAREWIRRHYDQWDVCSPAAHDMRAEMPWLEETP